MNSSIRRRLAGGKGKNQCRLRDIEWEDQPRPMFVAGSIKYDLAEKVRALACGGIGAMHTLARQSGLTEAIEVTSKRFVQKRLPGQLMLTQRNEALIGQ